MLDFTKSFIEIQFPVSKISKESYKERKANLSQTLTGLGKWWGRKPLILVRATLLGILMPVSEDTVKDKDIFLKILTMDNEGLWRRKSKAISTKDIYSHLNTKERREYFDSESTLGKPKYISGLNKEDKEYLQKLVFHRLSYDEKLQYCERPEHVNIDNEEVWDEINTHLGTNAYTLQGLVKELGNKRYGHNPRVGDCFTGGGSISFESARMGADVYAADLNPVASLLSWASLNIAGASDADIIRLREFQDKVYKCVDEQIRNLKIEHNEEGHRADVYLYCNEVECPECGYKVPLAPSWIIGNGSRTVAILSDNGNYAFDINIVQGATDEEIEQSKKSCTVRNGKVYCLHCNLETPISSLRGDRKNQDGNNVSGLRKWEKHEFIPREDDVFQERLYAIRYVGIYYDGNGNEKTRKYYISPSPSDLIREKKVIELLKDVFDDWQNNGYIPSCEIEPGDKTDEPIRTRGWQYWHQLFNPRQLLLIGIYIKNILIYSADRKDLAIGILGVNKLCDWNSKLSIWDNYAGNENVKNTFLNQALNTSYNYGTRGFTQTITSWFFNINNFELKSKSKVITNDARSNTEVCDIFITDPPYADAVNYHELTEFFLAWDKTLIEKAFPEWYADSKRVLAVKGTGQTFNDSMIEIYTNLANHMTENGTQVVLFTHQDVKVWSELAMILWSAGLRVVSAWNIATETESGGLKSGNYVKGTVLLTLKKQTSNEIVFQDELYDEIKHEVEKIIDSMHDLDDKDDPDFTDADYLLASYASSLKVLTAYKEIEGIDVHYWLSQPRNSTQENPIEALINKAVKIAYDYLIPEGFDKIHWKDLTPDERFFIRGLEIEMNGNYQISSYQELARGFGVKEYADMFAEFKANSTRLMTPSEFKMKNLGNGGFSSSVVRHLLVAINECTNSKSTVEGRSYLKSIYSENNEFWYKKPIMIEVLSFISRLEHVENMTLWHEHAYFAKILKEALKNEGV